MQCTLLMQHTTYAHLTNLVHKNYFQPEGMTIDAASHTTASLLVFLSDAQHEAIKYIHIGLVVHHTGCRLYNQQAIPLFILSIEVDQDSEVEAGIQQGFSLLVTNFDSLMATPNDPPYSKEVPLED